MAMFVASSSGIIKAAYARLPNRWAGAFGARSTAVHPVLLDGVPTPQRWNAFWWFLCGGFVKLGSTPPDVI